MSSLVSGLLNQTIDTIYSVSEDGYGDITETTLYTYVSCRWEEAVEQEVQIGGEAVIYSVQVWLLPDITIEEGYRINQSSEIYVVQEVIKHYDLDGNHDHTKVYLK